MTELIGSNTVNTMPEKTFEAFLDHGQTTLALPGDFEEANAIIAQLKQHGIAIDTVCSELLDQGVNAFSTSFDTLLKAIECKAKQCCRHGE